MKRKEKEKERVGGAAHHHGRIGEKAKKSALRRLTIIRGQIEGLARMVEGEAYCIDIIAQSRAAREALKGVEDLILQNHLEEHVSEQMRSGRIEQATSEVLTIYRAARK